MKLFLTLCPPPVVAAGLVAVAVDSLRRCLQLPLLLQPASSEWSAGLLHHAGQTCQNAQNMHLRFLKLATARALLWELWWACFYCLYSSCQLFFDVGLALEGINCHGNHVHSTFGELQSVVRFI